MLRFCLWKRRCYLYRCAQLFYAFDSCVYRSEPFLFPLNSPKKKKNRSLSYCSSVGIDFKRYFKSKTLSHQKKRLNVWVLKFPEPYQISTQKKFFFRKILLSKRFKVVRYLKRKHTKKKINKETYAMWHIHIFMIFIHVL